MEHSLFCIERDLRGQRIVKEEGMVRIEGEGSEQKSRTKHIESKKKPQIMHLFSSHHTSIVCGNTEISKRVRYKKGGGGLYR